VADVILFVIILLATVAGAALIGLAYCIYLLIRVCREEK